MGIMAEYPDIMFNLWKTTREIVAVLGCSWKVLIRQVLEFLLGFR